MEIKPADYDLDLIEPGEAIAIDWSVDRYFADTRCTSNSQLQTLKANPALYYKRHEARTLTQDTSSAAMDLGTLVHLAVLEPGQWLTRVVPAVIPRPDEANAKARKGSPERVAYDNWKTLTDMWSRMLAVTADAVPVTPEIYDKVSAMAASVQTHPFVAQVLLGGPGYNEQTVIWREPTTGLLIRMRVDHFAEREHPESGEPIVPVLDLKSTRDPSPREFGRSIAKFGYHCQAGLYHDGIQALYPGRSVYYGIVAVRNSEPYETACYELGEESLATGQSHYKAALLDLVERRKTNNWLAPWQEWCAPIDVPSWALQADPK